MSGEGIPYSLEEARKAAEVHRHLLSPYHHELLLWLIEQVETAQAEAKTLRREIALSLQEEESP